MPKCTRFFDGIIRQELYGQAYLHETTRQVVQEQLRPHGLSVFGQRASQIRISYLFVRNEIRNFVHKDILHI